jgi:hypothetical protein
MLECWNEDPNERKTFPELRSLFDAMLAENNPYIQFENINSHKPYYNATRRSQSQLPEDAGSTPPRNSRSEDENVVGLSESEIDFEASSTSTSTLNIPASESAYDYLRPLAPSVETPPATGELLLVTNPANPYVETPTFKYLMNQESFELSGNFEQQTQKSDEMESSTEVQVEIKSSANSATADE